MSHKLISLYIGEGEYYTRTDVDNVLAEKDQEIAELKLKLDEERNKQVGELKAKLEDAKATAYAESIDAGMENYNLKRALWLARLRSLRNFSVLTYYQVLRAKGKESNMDFNEMAYRINLACVKCRAKAEEYK